jgi:predicted Zn finger-like uncharacterized protein
MSLITSCPACGTMFRVVPDQLRISEGWVRCGHCAEVFDATSHLADHLPPEVREAMPTQPGELPPEWDFPMGPVGAPGPPLTNTVSRPASTLRTRAPTAAPVPAPAIVATPAPTVAPAPPLAAAERQADDIETLEPSPLDAPFVFRRSDLDFSDPAPSVLPPIAPRGRESVLPVEEEPAPDIDQVSFVRQARRRAFWRRPFVRFWLVLATLLLASLLALQFAYHDRDRLAAAQPQLKPWLELMCEQLQCQIAPSRQIEAIVIESSSFNKLRGDAYRLSFTLRNTAAVAVAAPAMELTLTDGQDQPVLRRVLTPAELGATGNVIEGAADWSGSVGIAVAPAGLPRIAGYRLLAFYP